MHAGNVSSTALMLYIFVLKHLSPSLHNLRSGALMKIKKVTKRPPAGFDCQYKYKRAKRVYFVLKSLLATVTSPYWVQSLSSMLCSTYNRGTFFMFSANQRKWLGVRRFLFYFLKKISVCLNVPWTVSFTNCIGPHAHIFGAFVILHFTLELLIVHISVIILIYNCSRTK